MAKGKPGVHQANPEVKKFLRKVAREGWTIEAGRQHARIRPPGGGPAVGVPCSPSTRDWVRIMRSKMRKALEESKTQERKAS